MERKEGSRGKEIQSNVTDNENVVIHSPQGYIQGYIGIAISDEKERIIVCAQAYGTANEGKHFPQMLNQSAKTSRNHQARRRGKIIKKTILADRNYFSEDKFDRWFGQLFDDGQWL